MDKVVDLALDSPSTKRCLGDEEWSIAYTYAETGSGKGSKETSQNDEASEVMNAVQIETRRVGIARTILLLMMSIIAVVVVALSYAVFNNQDRLKFEESFLATAQLIQESSRRQLDLAIRSSKELSEYMTETASVNGSLRWPFVTSYDFEAIARRLRNTSGFESMTYVPLVNVNDLRTWGNYSVEHQDWIHRSFDIDGRERPSSDSILDYIFWVQGQGIDAAAQPVKASEAALFAPVWQLSPPPEDPAIVNFDLFSLNVFQDAFFTVNGTKSWAMRSSFNATFAGLNMTAFGAELQSALASPIFGSTVEKSSDVVGILWSTLPWERYIDHDQSLKANGVRCVLRSPCLDKLVTYEFVQGIASIVGNGDLHDTNYDYFKHTFVINENQSALIMGTTASGEGACPYTFTLYPSSGYVDNFQSSGALTAALWMAFLVFLLVISFCAYDYHYRLRSDKVMKIAVSRSHILATLFPAYVRERLYADLEFAMTKEGSSVNYREQLQALLPEAAAKRVPTEIETDSGDDEGGTFRSRAIADFFTQTTVFFADIVGFTSWSSARQASEVFLLLETLYWSFDRIADRCGIFKVETVGDCYVAVTGLPHPRPDHAIKMSRFALACMEKFQVLTKKLEVALGPDTADLQLRIGLHSGPVTAGVLRGKRSRYQLFGDTMNTCARIESTCDPGRIQLSSATAGCLIEAGKGHWVRPREDTVLAKGKGRMQTYWLDVRRARSSNPVSEPTSDAGVERERLVRWAAELLGKLLKKVVARRQAQRTLGTAGRTPEGGGDLKYSLRPGSTAIDEIAEVIALPKFSAAVTNKEMNPEKIVLGEVVEEQLVLYVRHIAHLYRDDNPFHCFEHACRVLLSVNKLLSRIVAPSQFEANEREDDQDKTKTNKETDLAIGTLARDLVEHYVEKRKSDETVNRRKLHDHTYGITSDPLTQFACAFSALIHDCDHMGVPNTQLCKENPVLAAMYRSKSVAEQVSVDLAWDLLMDDQFSALRNTIYSDEVEMKRFRQLVVNSVMATDIMDKDLKDLRNARWNTAFSETQSMTSKSTNRDRKATIVIEHIIQASDISHTMQHFITFKQWNERLFREMTLAYKQGRAEKDPKDFWYQGEIGFFDFYIIPLAKKLKDCGVFGVSSAELLNYALLNRQEWEERGREIVAEYVESFQRDEAALLAARTGGTSGGVEECGVEVAPTAVEASSSALVPPGPPPIEEVATEVDAAVHRFL